MEKTFENEYLPIYIQLNYDYIKYHWEHICKKSIFDNLTIKLNDIISFVPNITCHSNGSVFKLNKSGYVYVYINTEKEKLLLIPGYMVPYFYENFILLDSRFLYLINTNMAGLYEENYEKIKKIKTNDILQFIEKGIKLKKTNNLIKFICFIILSQYTNLLPEHNDLIKNYEDNFDSISEYVKSEVSRWIDLKKEIFIDDKPGRILKKIPTDLQLFGIEPPPPPPKPSSHPPYPYHRYPSSQKSRRVPDDETWGGGIIKTKYKISYF